MVCGVVGGSDPTMPSSLLSHALMINIFSISSELRQRQPSYHQLGFEDGISVLAGKDTLDWLYAQDIPFTTPFALLAGRRFSLSPIACRYIAAFNLDSNLAVPMADLKKTS